MSAAKKIDQINRINKIQTRSFCAQVIRDAEKDGQRTGQKLMNILEPGPYSAITRSTFDPFHKDLSLQELIEWVDNHIIWDGPRIIAVFKDNLICWEA